MTDDSAALRERVGELERRVSELSRAAVRIGTSLDLDAVLREILDSARALTGAAVGAIATVKVANEINGASTRKSHAPSFLLRVQGRRYVSPSAGVHAQRRRGRRRRRRR